MTEPQICMAGVNFLVAAIYIGVAIPLLLGKIKRNGWYGVRVGKAYESEEMWLKINRFGARQFIGWSTVNIIAGTAALLLPVGANPDMAMILLLLIGPVLFGTMIPVIITLAWVSKL